MIKKVNDSKLLRCANMWITKNLDLKPCVKEKSEVFWWCKFINILSFKPRLSVDDHMCIINIGRDEKYNFPLNKRIRKLFTDYYYILPLVSSVCWGKSLISYTY